MWKWPQFCLGPNVLTDVIKKTVAYMCMLCAINMLCSMSIFINTLGSILLTRSILSIHNALVNMSITRPVCQEGIFSNTRSESKIYRMLGRSLSNILSGLLTANFEVLITQIIFSLIAMTRFSHYYRVHNQANGHNTEMQQGHVNGLVQDCSNSVVNALELLQSCTKPSMLSILNYRWWYREAWKASWCCEHQWYHRANLTVVMV